MADYSLTLLKVSNILAVLTKDEDKAQDQQHNYECRASGTGHYHDLPVLVGLSKFIENGEVSTDMLRSFLLQNNASVMFLTESMK